jgi:hypothetical protein
MVVNVRIKLSYCANRLVEQGHQEVMGNIYITSENNDIE